MTKNNYKLKLNETFPLRTGWLQKGINIIAQKEDAFKKENASKEFGLGTNMCSALKYYLKSANIIEERKQGKFQLTESFGRIIFDEDKFCELLFTIYLIHIHLVANEKNCIVYNRFFNSNINNVTKEYLTDWMMDFLQNEKEDVNISSLASDVQVMLRSYVKNEEENPEENMFNSPLSLLGLLNIENGIYKKIMPTPDDLDFRVVYYSIINIYKDDFNKNKFVKFNIDDLLLKINNPQIIFNLSFPNLLMYFEEMDKYGYIEFEKTAGLNTVIIREKTGLQKLYNDYKQSRGIK